jgi:hypothetical protein
MHPLREHIAGAASVHAVGLTDKVGIVYGKRFSRFQEIDWEE